VIVLNSFMKQLTHKINIDRATNHGECNHDAPSKENSNMQPRKGSKLRMPTIENERPVRTEQTICGLIHEGSDDEDHHHHHHQHQ
jgi:hypothetical protein